MLNPIWLTLLLLSVFLGGFSGNLGAVTAAALESAKTAVTLAISLAGLFALFLGIMRLAELSGLVNILARALKPVTRRLFPDIPADHPVMGAVAMNVASNMLGLGNASTPLGLKAMRGLEKLNLHPGIASNAMCTFLAMNTASVQLIPTTAVSILAMAGAKNPWAIIGSAFFATLCANITGLTAVKLLEKLPAYRLPPVDPANLPSPAQATLENGNGTTAEPEPIPAEASLPPITRNGRMILALYTLVMALMFFTLAYPDQANAILAPLKLSFRFPALSADLAQMGLLSRLVSILSLIALPIMFTFFPLYGRLRGVKVYEEFVEGAKEGFQVAVRIIPYLVAILVAVGMFRAAGGIKLISNLLGPLLLRIGFPVDLLPLVLVRPLSGSATTGLFTDVVKTFGPDSLTSLTAGTIFGSTETTFYVIAVYFGSVGIRRTRHAVPAGLLADAAGVIASIVICRVMFA